MLCVKLGCDIMRKIMVKFEIETEMKRKELKDVVSKAVDTALAKLMGDKVSNYREIRTMVGGYDAPCEHRCEKCGACNWWEEKCAVMCTEEDCHLRNHMIREIKGLVNPDNLSIEEFVVCNGELEDAIAESLGNSQVQDIIEQAKKFGIELPKIKDIIQMILD